MADSSAPQVFNIAAGRAFLPALAGLLLDEEKRVAQFGPAALQDFEILLPTRRAARDLAGLLVERAAAQGQAALLLPHIRTLGDLDEDAPTDTPSAPAAMQALTDLPAAIEPMARHYHLLTLIRFWAEKSGQMAQGGLNPVKLSALAFDLEQFLDQAQNEALDWDKLPSLVPDELAENWQHTLTFLEIITAFWPQMLEEMGRMDPTARRNALLAMQRAHWRDTPPTHPVIAAGSTGSIRATADLLAVVARLPRGAVILPGLDRHVSAAEWQTIGKNVSHPQYALAHLLAHMQVSRAEVQDWPSDEAANDGVPPCAQDRAALLGLALAPADETAQWATKIDPAAPPALPDFHLIEAPEPRAEAGAIAVLMREVLQAKHKTAALVTRDRNLARRVAAELQRWDIHVDDSAGQPLANQPMANFLRRVLACRTEDFAPVALLAVLKHPLAHIGLPRGQHMAVTRYLEKRLLRGPRLPGGLAGLQAALAALAELRGQREASSSEDGAAAALLARLHTAFAPLMALPDTVHLAEHIAALLATATALMADGQSRNEAAALAQLQEGEEGRALSHLLQSLQTQSALAGPIAMRDWPALFDMWLYRQPVRPQTPVNPRLMILGPLEARLMQADVMILGGLNEGSWPPLPETGPWLSRPMRAALGMSQPERQIGQAAHDFVQYAAAGEVYVTRSRKIDGTPAVAARWLRRLETLCGALPRQKGETYLAWWQALDAQQGEAQKTRRPLAAAPPAPCPPVAARPDRLSVTQIETLLHNPYEIYAKKILALPEWEALDAPPSAADRGSLLHLLFERFIGEKGHMKADAAARFMALAQELQDARPGGAALLVFWQARLEAIAAWLATYEQERAAHVQDSHVELSGEMELMIDGAPFRVTAKADRIDALADGRFEIIDYKTGAPPSASKVKAHEKPQLTLEAAILARGGFALADNTSRILQGETARVSYWQINGRLPPAKLSHIEMDAALQEGAVDMVSKLIAAYRDAARPYHAHIRPGREARAYDHLARRAEWRRSDDTTGDASSHASGGTP